MCPSGQVLKVPCEQIEEGGDNVAASWQLAHPEETRKFQGTQMTAKKASCITISYCAAAVLNVWSSNGVVEPITSARSSSAAVHWTATCSGQACQVGNWHLSYLLQT